MLIYPGQIAAHACRQGPIGTPHEGKDTACCLCGMPIKEGDLASPFQPASSFINQNALCSDGQTLCGYCPTIFKRATPSGEPVGSMLQKQNTLITMDGIYPINKNENIVWFLRNIPKPPFVASITTAKAQHVVWRATPTLDRQLVFIQLGDHTVSIRYRFLMDTLIPGSKRMGDALSETTGKPHAPNPFTFLNMRENVVGAGDLHPKFGETLTKHPELHNDLETLLKASHGELWAMSYLCRLKEIEPKEPEARFSRIATQKSD